MDSITAAPAAEASLAPAPVAEASLAPEPAAEASLSPAPAAEEDWRKEEREKGLAVRLYLSQLDPEECFRSVHSTLAKMYALEDTKSDEQPVKKSWMSTVIEELRPTTTDPDILKARYRIERLQEERETIENGMKWMRKEALQAFKSYISSAGYNKNFEYDFVRLDFQCLIYGTFSKSYHHYNFTMRTRLSRSKPWTFQQFFAEVKPRENETKYFCCPLQSGEDEKVLGQLFDAYGVNEVCLLKQSMHLEAFVEFQSWHEASEARGALHGRCIYDGCCLLDIQHAPVSISVMRLPNSEPVVIDWDQVEVASLAATQPPSSSTSAPASANNTSMAICKVSTEVHAEVGRPVIVMALDSEEVVDLPAAPHGNSAAAITNVREAGEDLFPATAGCIDVAPTTCSIESLSQARRPSSDEDFMMSLFCMTPHPPWVTELVSCESQGGLCVPSRPCKPPDPTQAPSVRNLIPDFSIGNLTSSKAAIVPEGIGWTLWAKAAIVPGLLSLVIVPLVL
ncbi:hypothetical protein QYE76_002115 [Lolium multiflorum]|uniref:RRM domain-containing protein n=1 Tax=Lolium multiflorum TaxID=4521 RepID=A0AAD8RLX7_LOLMU|nr:hypothetical protein QYE76_002115 [Lolium multiflorum]